MFRGFHQLVSPQAILKKLHREGLKLVIFRINIIVGVGVVNPKNHFIQNTEKEFHKIGNTQTRNSIFLISPHIKTTMLFVLISK